MNNYIVVSDLILHSKVELREWLKGLIKSNQEKQLIILRDEQYEIGMVCGINLK